MQRDFGHVYDAQKKRFRTFQDRVLANHKPVDIHITLAGCNDVESKEILSRLSSRLVLLARDTCRVRRYSENFSVAVVELKPCANGGNQTRFTYVGIN